MAFKKVSPTVEPVTPAVLAAIICEFGNTHTIAELATDRDGKEYVRLTSPLTGEQSVYPANTSLEEWDALLSDAQHLQELLDAEGK